MKTKKFQASARLKGMFGFYADDVMTYEDAMGQILEEHRPLVEKAIEKSVIDLTKYDIEFAVQGFHDKRLRWLRGVGAISGDQEIKADIFTGVLHDITTHKQDELRKNDFIAMVSHELKSPITSIQAYVQVSMAIAKKINSDLIEKALSKAIVQTKKMTELINGFLNISSFEAGKIYLSEENFAIKDLIVDAIEGLKLLHERRIIEITESCDNIIYADRNKIAQVINNFLTNAIKYSPNEKPIEVSCKSVDNQLQICVRDEGIGIEPIHKEKLFDRYYRIENKNTKGIAGFGLGLYLCSEIIQRHGGKIWVESKIEEGSTFYFSLPIGS